MGNDAEVLFGIAIATMFLPPALTLVILGARQLRNGGRTAPSR